MKTINELLSILLSKDFDLIIIRTEKDEIITNSEHYRNVYHFKNPIQLKYIKPLKQCRFQKICEIGDYIEFKAYKFD